MEFSDMYKNRSQTSYLHIYDMESRQSRVVKEFTQVIEAPMWSKDGKAILYNSEGLIYRYALDTDETTVVDTGNICSCNNDHVLSPDGTAIAISGNADGSIVSKIYTVTIGSGEAKEVVGTPWSYLHGWSPDGTTLAYCAGRVIGENMEWDIYTCSAAGGEETRLTNSEGLNDGPEYSFDGKEIWFNSVRTGKMQIWKMNTDGSGQIQMTFDEDKNAWFPHISPDGERVVYLAYNAEDLAPGDHLPDLYVELRMISSKGGKPVTLEKLFGGQGTINVNSWAPDSKKFAYVSYKAP